MRNKDKCIRIIAFPSLETIKNFYHNDIKSINNPYVVPIEITTKSNENFNFYITSFGRGHLEEAMHDGDMVKFEIFDDSGFTGNSIYLRFDSIDFIKVKGKVLLK